MTVPSRLPIVQAPMAGGPSTPELAAAVGAAGGFGYVAAGYLTPDGLRAALEHTRALAGGPVGVNVFVPGPRAADPAAIEAYARSLRPLAGRLGVEPGPPRWDDDAYAAKLALLESAGVHTVSFTFGCPAADVVGRLRRAGVRVSVTVTGRAEAEQAAAAGADSLTVQGTEAGGHQASFDGLAVNETPLRAALEQLRDVGLPLIATGGIMTAEHTSDALAAGAIAVQVGTSLLCTPEAGTSAPHRAALLEGRYDDTVVTRAYSGRYARGLRNRFAREHTAAPNAYPEVHYLTRPLRQAATKAGDAEVPNLWAGTNWRSVEAASAADVIRRLTPR